MPPKPVIVADKLPFFSSNAVPLALARNPKSAPLTATLTAPASSDAPGASQPASQTSKPRCA